MKWLTSLDELLYEVMSWLLFFPLTLWRATLRPFHTMAEARRQRALPPAEQFATILSPPLFLALGLLLAHGIASALGLTDAIIANRRGLASLVDDNTSALALRMVVFAAFPLFLAARLVRAERKTLDRRSLREPFYEQCYPATVFALGVSIGTSLTLISNDRAHVVGTAVAAAAICNFVIVQIRWFSQTLRCGFFRALGFTAAGIGEGLLFLAAVGFLFTR